VKDENGVPFVDSHITLNRQNNYFWQLLNIHVSEPLESVRLQKRNTSVPVGTSKEVSLEKMERRQFYVDELSPECRTRP
jgi:hypothetical protein